MWNSLQWIMGFTGLAGVGWIALAFFAPSVLSVVAEYLKALSPLARGLADGLVEFFKILYAGLKDVTDNLSTIIFVCVLAGFAYLYGLTSQAPTLIQKPVEVVREYKAKKKIRRNTARKKVSRPRVRRKAPKVNEDWKSFLGN